MTIGTKEFTLLASRGKRKFEIALMIIASATALCWQGCITGEEYKPIMIGVMGLYGLANVATHFAKKEQ